MGRAHGLPDVGTVIRGLVLLALLGWAVWGLLQIPGDGPDRPLDATDPVPGRTPPGLLGAGGRPPPAHPAGGAPAPPDTAPSPASRRDVTLRIEGPDGQPARQVFVQWWRQGGGGFGSGRADEGGRIVLPALDITRLHRLQVEPHILGDDVLPLDVPAWKPRDATIRLERALAITGSVIDEHGQPVTGHGVFYRLVGADAPIHRADLHDHGLFRIAPLVQGRYQVCAVFNDPWRPHPPEGFGEGAMPDGAGAQTVEAGTRDLTLRVRRGAILRVHVEDWDSSRMSWGHALVLGRDGEHFVSKIDLKGRVAFCRLPDEGLYRLRRYGLPGNHYVEAADLPTGEVVHEVKLLAGREIRGHLALPAAAPPDRVAVQAWRVLAGRDPATGPDVAELVVQGTVDGGTSRYRLQGLPPGRWYVRASVDVLRDGQRTTLSASGRATAGEDLDLALRGD